MKRTILISVIVLFVSATAVAPVVQPASAAEWEDECVNAKTVSDGVLEGRLSPSDTDAFLLDMDEGDYKEMRFEWNADRVDQVFFLAEDSYSYFSLAGLPANDAHDTAIGQNYDDYYVESVNGGDVSEFELYAEEDEGTVCVQLRHRDDSATEWTLEIGDTQSSTAVSKEHLQDLESTVESQEETIAELEGTVTSQEERITELESTVESREETVADLESQVSEKDDRIDELETQLENADVSIDVTVESQEAESFRVGGELSTSVEVDGGSPSDVSIGFDNEQYTPTDGTVDIPLESAGTHELSVTYGDATETVSLDVADADTGTDDAGADGGDSSTTEQATDGSTNGEGSASDDGTGTGFGTLVALVGLLSVSLLSLRRHRS